MPKAKGKLYGPVGQCIYGIDHDGKLTDEHIVPANMGGEIVLKASSCIKCQKKLNEEVDKVCMRRMFRDIRYRRGIGSRRIKERPKHLSAMEPINWDRDRDEIISSANLDIGQWKQKGVPYNQHATILVLPSLAAPGILRGVPPKDSSKGFFLGMRKCVQMPENEPDHPIYVETEFNVPVFLRFIAKIAHGLAVFRYGVNGFDPYLLDFIVGKDFPNFAYYIGGNPQPPDHPQMPFYWRVSRHAELDLVFVAVQPFADLDAPIYLAIVGKYRPDRARLNPYDAFNRK